MSGQILIIDDDQDTRKMISLMLRRQGYDILTADSGATGVSIALAEEPDVILLDVMMPDMDGFEVCRQLRAEPVTTETPIIMFTAKTLVEDKVAGFKAGVTDYLTKPIHPAELSARIKNALRVAQPNKDDSDLELPTDTPSQSVGLVGAKGGIGTTTLAASVGAILAKGHSTILTDIRPGQGTLNTSLGITDNARLGEVLSLPANQIKDSLVAQHLANHSSKMQLLLSSQNPQEFTFNYSSESILALKRVLSARAHFCLFDLGAGLYRNSVPLMRELDKIILLTEPDLLSLPIASSILTVLETRIRREQIQLVISRRTESSYHMSVPEVEDWLGRKCAMSIPPVPDMAYQAAKERVTLTQQHPDSAIVKEISKFVKELVKPV